MALIPAVRGLGDRQSEAQPHAALLRQRDQPHAGQIRFHDCRSESSGNSRSKTWRSMSATVVPPPIAANLILCRSSGVISSVNRAVYTWAFGGTSAPAGPERSCTHVSAKRADSRSEE